MKKFQWNEQTYRNGDLLMYRQKSEKSEANFVLTERTRHVVGQLKYSLTYNYPHAERKAPLSLGDFSNHREATMAAIELSDIFAAAKIGLWD